MTKSTFLDMVRQYARKAQLSHKSYAEPVAVVRQMYLESNYRGEADPAFDEQLVKETDAALLREYAKYDDKWESPASS